MFLLYRYEVLLVFCLSLIFIKPAYSSEQITDTYQSWLKNKFASQHEKLLPVVAVADMFYGCNAVRQIDPKKHQVKDLIVKMDQNQLADKLIECLGKSGIKSEEAINFGLIGCFTEQFTLLKPEDKKEKLKQVNAILLTLSYPEKQKTFTKCTTMQAIDYLK